jgi:hypothetical protein
MEVMIPPPSLLGIVDPVSTGVKRSAQAASGTTNRTVWHPTRDRSAQAQASRASKAEQTDLTLDSAADHDRFNHLPPDHGVVRRTVLSRASTMARLFGFERQRATNAASRGV